MLTQYLTENYLATQRLASHLLHFCLIFVISRANSYRTASFLQTITILTPFPFNQQHKNYTNVVSLKCQFEFKLINCCCSTNRERLFLRKNEQSSASTCCTHINSTTALPCFLQSSDQEEFNYKLPPSLQLLKNFHTRKIFIY